MGNLKTVREVNVNGGIKRQGRNFEVLAYFLDHRQKQQRIP
jgi:hypothetical protein